MKIILLLLLIGVSSFFSLNYANADISDLLSLSQTTTWNTPYYSITTPSIMEYGDPDSTPNAVIYDSENMWIELSGFPKLPIDDRDKWLNEIIIPNRKDGCESKTMEKDEFECTYTVLDSYKSIRNGNTVLTVFDQSDRKRSIDSEKEDDVKKCYADMVLADDSSWFLLGCFKITNDQLTNPFMGFGENMALKVLRESMNSFELHNTYSMPIEEILETIDLKVADFIDFSKTPQYYLDRYNNELSYKEWFDKNYEGITINAAIGFPSTETSQDILKEQGYLHKELLDNESEEIPSINDSTSKLEQEIKELKEKIRTLEAANKKLQETIDNLKNKVGTDTKIKKEIASFVEADKDPQSYIDRYNNELSYKEWFDDNYSEYESIHEAVGKRKPIPDWIKNNAIWWSEGKLSEDEFMNGIEYLVKQRIIQVD